MLCFFPLEDDVRKIHSYLSRLGNLIISTTLNDLEGEVMGKDLPKSTIKSILLGRTTIGNADILSLQFEGHFHTAWRFSKCIHV